MKPAYKSLLYLTFPLVTWGTLVTVGSVRAQSQPITPDTTLGNENSVVITNVDVGKSIPSDRIDGGATRGKNLFHSFSKFDIDEGRGAYFSNPTGIENIISRVTGSNASNILGTLGVLGNANLFFANPNGIVFGPNARLDVSGSFFASTSDSFIFDNGFEFSASNPQAPPLLTVNMPIGLRFRDNPGSITIGNDQVTNPTSNSVSIQVQPGKTLAFVGGEINLNGRRLRAPGGRIELGALAAEGVVGINNDFSLSFPENVARADVSMNAADVDVTSGDKGSISINAKNINILSNSDLCAGIGADAVCGGLATNSGSVGNQAGDITLNALETITIADSGSSVNNQVNTNAVGTGGDVNIKAGSVVLNNGGSISTSTFGQGNSGKINISARDTVSVDGGENGSFIFNNVLSDAVGNSGGINITTGSLFVTNGFFIASATLGRGNSGKISINARDNVSFDNGSVLSNVLEGAVGNSGGVDITTGSLSVNNGARVLSNSEGTGNAGNITVKAQDTISLANNSFIFSNVGNFQGVSAVGNVGDIQIEGRTVSVTDTSQIQAGFFSNTQGDSGSVSIKAKESVSFSGRNSGIFADVFSNTKGNGSDVEISAQSFSLTDGAVVFTSNAGTGNAGNVKLDIRKNINISGISQPTSNGTFSRSGIFSSLLTGAIGNGGDISIITESFSLTDGARVFTSSEGIGNAGNITVKAQDTISLSKGSLILSNIGNPQGVSAVGNVGDIQIEGRTVSVTDTSQIQAGFFSNTQGNPGSVSIKAKESVSFSGRGSGIRADVFSNANGDGSDVEISAQSFSLNDGAELVTSNQGNGNGGDIIINVGSLFLTNNSIMTSDTFGAGNAGNIKLNVSDLIRISGTRSGIFANTRGDSTGNGGNISIDPKTVEILDGARISADSRGTGKPGNINIVSDELLLLRRGATISTNATQDTDGGNIRIKTGVLVALPKENSDISANANRGNGGRVDITAQGIFGIVPRDASTDFSDITTSSEFGISGTVTINNPEVDPTQGLVELPETVVDAKNQIAQNPCQQGINSTFFATGRGGLPTSPAQDLSSGTVRVGLATSVVSKTTASNPTASQPKSTPTAKRFVPAQGWVFNSKGQVVLTAYDPNSTGVQRTSHKGLCAAR